MVIQTLGIVTAYGPHLKPLLDSVNSSIIRNNNIRRRARGIVNGNYGAKDSKSSKDSRSSIRAGGIF